MYTLDEIDGETRQPKPEFLEELAASAERIVRHAEESGIATNAAHARRLRHCLWGGQHWTERHWDTRDKAAYPFHGASDFRYRLADMLANQRVAEGWTALARAKLRFGAPGEDQEAAAWCEAAWRDISRREIPREWMVQNLLLLQYLHGGGRGVAGMMTGWCRKTELRMRVVANADALSAWVAAAGARGSDPVAAADAYAFALAQPVAGEADGLADILRESGLARNAADSRRAARALREEGRAEMPREEVAEDRPFVRALCVGDDLWVPPETMVADLDAGDEYHLTEWHSRASLRAMAAREDWDKRFLEGLVGDGKDNNGRGHAGKAAFPVWELNESDDGTEVLTRVEARQLAEHYQIVRSYVRAVDRDGIPARYEVVWTPLVKEVTARGVRMMRTAHGSWPVQLYASEVLGPQAMHSRGLPGLAAGVQAHGKVSHDTVANIGMLQLPPILSQGRKGQGDLLIEPLGEIPLSMQGRVEFMKPPQVPYATIQYLKQLDDWRDLYFGLPGENVPPLLWQTAQALRVGLFLGQASETVRRVLAEFAGQLPVEALPEPMRGTGVPPVQMQFNPRELDMEYVKALGETVNVLMRPMDAQGRLNTDEVLETMALAMMPDHAETLIRTKGAAQAREIEDEQKNLTLIRAGIRPRVNEGGGSDYAGRLAMYAQMLEADPAVFDDMVPEKRQLLAEHMAALQQQATQYGENRAIGRYGSRMDAAAIGEA